MTPHYGDVFECDGLTAMLVNEAKKAPGSWHILVLVTGGSYAAFWKSGTLHWWEADGWDVTWL